MILMKYTKFCFNEFILNYDVATFKTQALEKSKQYLIIKLFFKIMSYSIIIIFHFWFPDLNTIVSSITLKILKFLENNTFWLSLL